jgi:hypothetical protein
VSRPAGLVSYRLHPWGWLFRPYRGFPSATVAVASRHGGSRSRVRCTPSEREPGWRPDPLLDHVGLLQGTPPRVGAPPRSRVLVAARRRNAGKPRTRCTATATSSPGLCPALARPATRGMRHGRGRGGPSESCSTRGWPGSEESGRPSWSLPPRHWPGSRGTPPTMRDEAGAWLMGSPWRPAARRRASTTSSAPFSTLTARCAQEHPHGSRGPACR